MKHTDWYREFHDSSILLGWRGSVTFGTYRAGGSSDKDVMGVIIHPPSHYFGFQMQETYERMEKSGDTTWDFVGYELRHFVRLLCKANPNVMALLWLPDNMYIKQTPLGKELIANRKMFATKLAYNSFTGYAYSQLHRMNRKVTTGDLGAKRKAIVEAYGFDTKHASTLIMLMNMCVEFLATGELQVHREENTYLVDIKQGKYPIEHVQEEAQRLFRLAQEAMARSTLPNAPDMEKVNGLLTDLVRRGVEQNA